MIYEVITGPVLEIRGKVREIKGRKVVVEATVYADGVATATGEVMFEEHMLHLFGENPILQRFEYG